MWKYIFLQALLLPTYVAAQATLGSATITKNYSENGEFFIESTPFDNEFPSVRGKSIVYRDSTQLYTVNRSFNYFSPANNYLAISNDGQTVAYFLSFIYGYQKDTVALNEVTVYKNGKLVKSMSMKAFNGCDPDTGRCELLYDNSMEVLDKEKSKYGTKDFKEVLKPDISEEELFLHKHAAWTINDTVYITDKRKMVTLFDLQKLSVIKRKPFQEIYSVVKNRKINNQQELKIFQAPHPDKAEFPNLISGQKTGIALGEYLGMKPIAVNDSDFFKYKSYRITIQAYIDQNGKIEIEKLEADRKLPLKEIRHFFEAHIYDMKFLPKEFDKFYFNRFFYSYRNSNDSIASQETREATTLAIQEKAHRLTMDSVNHFYIPKDLNDCLLQLDTILSTITKKEIKALNKDLYTINGHMGGLGMWMRNNWGLHGGSRLLKYFNDRGISSPDHMSGIIIEHYFNRLNGKLNTWKDWEAANPVLKKSV